MTNLTLVQAQDRYVERVLACQTGHARRVRRAALRQDRARKAFHRYLEAARVAGVEDGFMARFNSAARYGDSLDAVIQGWGAARIRRMYEEAMPK